MRYTIDLTRFAINIAAAFLIISGVLLKNSLEDLKIMKKKYAFSAMALFITGWLLFAYSTTYGTKDMTKMFMVFASSAVIVLSVAAIKFKLLPAKYASIAALLFAAAWLNLGYWTTRKAHFDGSALGIFAATLVIISMIALLPWQRKHKVIFGPGLVLFTTAWFIISALNARVK